MTSRADPDASHLSVTGTGDVAPGMEPPEPTRAAGLARLEAFVDRAGRAYAAKRNYDRPQAGHPHVSRLSPYLRHRLVTEAEVLSAVTARHGADAAEKFVQEVFWRTYFKGWLERRPAVWAQYREGVSRAVDRVQTESGLRRSWEAACRGETGIAAFDHWAHELAATGYLHNHARMWFASIWCFTLELPWELGADFFLRHLYDGDPASNTLGWRWVAGLHTRGRTYLARPDNIARYTDGRFRPDRSQLAGSAEPVDGPDHPPLQPAPEGDAWSPAPGDGWLLTEDDLSPDLAWPDEARPPMATLRAADARSPLKVAPHVLSFTDAALDDAVRRLARTPEDVVRCRPERSGDDLLDWARSHDLRRVVTAWTPTGPAADRLEELEPRLADAGVALVRVLRDYDRRAWPHATAGFFKFKARIPKLLAALEDDAA